MVKYYFQLPNNVCKVAKDKTYPEIDKMFASFQIIEIYTFIDSDVLPSRVNLKSYSKSTTGAL